MPIDWHNAASSQHASSHGHVGDAPTKPPHSELTLGKTCNCNARCRTMRNPTTSLVVETIILPPVAVANRKPFLALGDPTATIQEKSQPERPAGLLKLSYLVKRLTV